MATSFKDLSQDDRKVTRTLLHESIPITGALLKGTYATSSAGRGVNIKTFEHGMFQSVYDYPYASSSANHIFDLTCGFSTSGDTVSGSATVATAKKVNVMMVSQVQPCVETCTPPAALQYGKGGVKGCGRRSRPRGRRGAPQT